ncbi:AAA family ATPase [Sphaerisporangium viridialbum]|uniref:AAA family ATPase n=1 Tax=Sphaerisporangium viridialbum TaxID=46189 RepID=UPI003C7782FE
MRADVDDPAFAEQDDRVGRAQGGGTVGDDERGVLARAARRASSIAASLSSKLDTASSSELPRSVDDFTGRAAELAWADDFVHAGDMPGAAGVALVTGAAGLGKTTFAVRAAHMLRPSFPDGMFFVDLFGMSAQPLTVDDALMQLLRALGTADRPMPPDPLERASLYRSLLRERRVLVVLDNAGSEEQVRPLLPGGGPSRALVTSRRLLAGLEGVHRLSLGPLPPVEAAELLTGISALGTCLRDAGHYAEALEQYLDLWGLLNDDQLGITPSIAAFTRPIALARVGECLGLLGHRTEAIIKLTEAISLMEQAQLPVPQARSLETLAALLADEGRTGESRRAYARAAEVYEAIGDADASSRCHDLANAAP